MLHVPSQIISLGPLIRHMCMRFESKHCFFKNWSSKLNFRNVCKSLVNHNQRYECCQNALGTEHPIFVHEKELGPVSEVDNLEYIRIKIREFLGIDGIKHAVKVKWISLNGNKYISERSLIIVLALSKEHWLICLKHYNCSLHHLNLIVTPDFQRN